MDTPQLVSSVPEKLFWRIWNITNPKEDCLNLQSLVTHVFCVCFGRHMTKRQSDWPELFGMASQGVDPKIPDHFFRVHFVSGSGGMGTRLSCDIGWLGISSPIGPPDSRAVNLWSSG